MLQGEINVKILDTIAFACSLCYNKYNEFYFEDIMKKIHLFATKPWYFLVTLPPIFVFVLCLVYHPNAEGKLGLIPLALMMVGVVVFSVLFFFRTIRISNEEIREIGVFSGGEHMDLTLGREVILVRYPHASLGVYVFGEDGAEEQFWLLNEKPKEHILMRSRAVGGSRSIARVLSFFGVDANRIPSLCTTEGLSFEGEFVSVTTLIENENLVVRIKINKALEVFED